MFHRISRVCATGAALGSLSIGIQQSSKSLFSYSDTKIPVNPKIVIIGGGSAGIGVAAMLKNEGLNDIVIIEPKSVHYYQPMWTLVGCGLASKEDSVRAEKDVIPEGVKWLKESVTQIVPSRSTLVLSSGERVDYDYLVVAAGIQIDWNKIPGLTDSVGKPGSGVVSIYDYNYSEATSKAIDEFKGGRALFTMPTTPIKCAGAPQKIMWLFEEKLRDTNRRNNASVEFWTPGEMMFGVKYYADKLEVIRAERNVVANYKRDLVSVDAPNKIATFKNLATGELSQESFDLLHVVPPMSAPDFLKQSPLANAVGYVDVDKHTLQSTKYPNVFAIGDCCSAPVSKTIAAITAQAPVLVHNLLKKVKNEPLDGKYNGYASCPLIIGKNRVILAEFGYDGKIMETFNPAYGKFPYTLIGQDSEMSQRFFSFLKTELFPFAYWNLWIKGHWYGSNCVFKPDATRTLN